MMEIKRDMFNDIKKRVLEFRTDDNYELEAKYKGKIDKRSFTKVLKFLRSVGWKEDIHPETLDINADRVRISVVGKDAIHRYCLNNMLEDGPHVTLMKKKKIGSFKDSVVLSSMNFNIDIRKEVILDDEKNELIQKINDDQDLMKFYRLKKRFTYTDGMFRYDCTVVKSSPNKTSYKSFVEAELVESYEIEIEVLHIKTKEQDENIAKYLIQRLLPLYELLTEGDEGELNILPDNDRYAVMKNYLDMCMGNSVDVINALRNPRFHFFGPQPVTLERKNLLDDLGIVTILKDYTVTDKADGERMLLFVDDNEVCYLINNRLEIMDTKYKMNGYARSLLDGEYVTKNKVDKAISVYAVFDIYFYRGKDVRQLPLVSKKGSSSSDDRLGFMKLFVNSLPKKNGLDIKIKDFRYNNIFKDSKSIYEENTVADRNGYHIDGLIYTPMYLGVGCEFEGDVVNNIGTWNKVFKWKPPSENTIDFLVEFDKDSKGNVRKLYDAGHTITNLHVGYDPVQWERIKALQYLRGEINRPKAGTYTKKLFVPPDEDSSIGTYIGDLVCKDKSIIKDNTIVEFSYDRQAHNWVPLRVRVDKTELLNNNPQSISGTANDYRTALNVWRSIQEPVTMEHIFGEKIVTVDDIKEEDVYYSRSIARDKMATKQMITFHNKAKESLLTNLPLNGRKNTSLFDIACGKAGDLRKWINANIVKVLGVDVSRDNIENPNDGAYSRTYDELNGIQRKGKGFPRKNPMVENYAYLTMDCSKVLDKKYIDQMTDVGDKHVAQVLWGIKEDEALKKWYSFAKNQFDIVSCQFAVHYFFSDKNALENFAKNVDAFLKPGGYLIGTCLDGVAVKKLLKDIKVSEEKSASINGRTLWNIKKLYNNENKIKYGEQIEIYMESIGKRLKEYLVDMKLLESVFNKYNITIVRNLTRNFQAIYDEFLQNTRARVPEMSDEEKQYSFLNMAFTFQKMQSASTSQATTSQATSQATTSPSQNSSSESDVSPPRFMGLIEYNGRNSCYIDAIIMALLHYQPNKWLHARLFDDPINKNVKSKELKSAASDLRSTLKDIYDKLHTQQQRVTCSNVRTSLEKFDRIYCQENNINEFSDRKWKSSQQDYREVLTILDRAFDLENAVKISTQIKEKRSNRIIRNEDLNDQQGDFDSQIINVYDNEKESLSINDYCPKFKEQIYNEITKTTIVKTISLSQAKTLFFKIIRAQIVDDQQVKNTKPVIPLEYLKISTTNNLRCVSILVHSGKNIASGHYTCVFKSHKDKAWYMYDDMETSFKKIGDTFNSVLEYENGFVQKNMVGCLYVP